MNDDERGLKMRYSRAERLERAGPELKALYERRAGPQKRGFLSILRGNRNMSTLFATIVAFALIAAAYVFLSDRNEGQKIGGYRAKLEASYEPGGVAMTLRLSRAAFAAKAAKGETVLARTSTDGSVFSAREFALSGASEETYYFRLATEGKPESVECLLTIGASQVDLRVPVIAAAPGGTRR